MAKIVKVVLPVDPVIARIWKAVGLVANVANVRSFAVVQSSLEQLHAENAEYHKERTADQHDVSDGPERAEQRLYDQLQAGCSIDDSVGMWIGDEQLEQEYKKSQDGN